MYYAGVMYLSVMPSVLQSQRERNRERERDTEREREREVMNWATFNYTCVYVGISDAQCSSVSAH